ncbi:MAG: SDR family NAD(P)-dependent oxidoreductase [Caldilineaceae bacterium]
MNILITGATDGIGLALARFYAEHDIRPILVGRRDLAQLDHTLFTPERYCQVDLATPESPAMIVAWLQAKQIEQLDLVIHNAALGYVGDLIAQPISNINQLLQVNLWTPIALTHSLYPWVAKAKGRFGFISSVAAGLPGPNYAIYTVTKAALEGFVRSWQIELAASKAPVTAQIIRPGATRTHMHTKSGADPATMHWERFPTPERVASQIAHALRTDRRAFSIGVANGLAYTVGHTWPALVDRAMTPPFGVPALLEAVQALETPPHCVITGAADGIGRALAQVFAAAGYVVTGIDVDAPRAMQTQADIINAGGQARFLIADLLAPNAVENVLDVLATRPPITVFIHNAGISAVGAFVDLELAAQQRVLALNLNMPLRLTAALLQAKRLAPQSSLVFISSLSHFAGYPGASVYAASKDGVAAYARSLAVALAPQGMKVLTVYPGPTRTAHARRYSPNNSREERRMAPERLAQLILASVQKGRRQLIPGINNQAAAWLGRFFPPLIEQVMRRTTYDRLPAKPLE